jgi:hypothetical protein
MALTDQKFAGVASLVIKNMEGGYYHPDMLSDGRVKDSRYSASGETMYGIDRLAGGEINKTPAGIEFWSLVDGANARKTWKWNYMGGALARRLQQLAASMMRVRYDRLAATYLSPKTKEAVEKDERLLFHFVYACWNGDGWFKKFASDMNAAISSGVRDPGKLSEVAVASRTAEGLKEGSAPNSLIAQGGKKIEGLFDSGVLAAAEKKKWLILAIVAATLLAAGLVVYWKVKKKGK